MTFYIFQSFISCAYIIGSLFSFPLPRYHYWVEYRQMFDADMFCGPFQSNNTDSAIQEQELFPKSDSWWSGIIFCILFQAGLWVGVYMYGFDSTL